MTPRVQELQKRWNAGESAQKIAEALGYKDEHTVRQMITYYRRHGYEFTKREGHRFSTRYNKTAPVGTAESDLSADSIITPSKLHGVCVIMDAKGNITGYMNPWTRRRKDFANT